MQPTATSTCSGPSSWSLKLSEYSKYVFAPSNSQCIWQIFPKFLHFSEMPLSWTWKKLSRKNTLSVTIVKAFKCGAMCLVFSLFFSSGIAPVNSLNDVMTLLTTSSVWLSAHSFVTVLITSCTTWWSRIKQPPSSSWNSRSELLFNLMRINSLSASSNSSCAFMM